MVYLKFGIVFFPLIYASVLGNCNEGTEVASETTEEPYTLHIKIFLSACIGSVFSLKFSSVGKGPFTASKEKIWARGALSWGQRRGGGGGGGSGLWDMAPPLLRNFELSSLKRHSLILRPILHRSAVHIFIYFVVACENRSGSQLGKKCSFRR